MNLFPTYAIVQSTWNLPTCDTVYMEFAYMEFAYL